LIHADAFMQGSGIERLNKYKSPFNYIEHTLDGRFIQKKTAMINGEEHRAIYLENRIRAEHGLWLRGLW